MFFRITQDLKEATIQLLKAIPCGMGDNLAAKLSLAWNDPAHVVPADETGKITNTDKPQDPPANSPA